MKTQFWVEKITENPKFPQIFQIFGSFSADFLDFQAIFQQISTIFLLIFGQFFRLLAHLQAFFLDF